ncbi:MAG: hypothetical protein ACLGP3_04915, partial [Acidobacteriota bacterium]
MYVLGAGASAGQVPLGNGLLWEPAIAHLRGGSYSATLPRQALVTRKSFAVATGGNRETTLATLFGHREVRLGTPEFPLEEMLARQTDFRTILHMLHLLAKPLFHGVDINSYRAFSSFKPGVILNYNLDGLASYWCRPRHRVIVPHGTVEVAYGSPYIAEYLEHAGSFDLPPPLHELLLCVPESETEQLRRNVDRAFLALPDFVAVVGYSFGRYGDAYDD